GATTLFCGIRGVWPIDCGPTGNIHRRDVVGQPREAAGHTLEARLRHTIMLIDTTTAWTGPRGIAGVNLDHLHPVQPCLVNNLVFQVIEGPAMQCGSLRLPNRYPVADAAQVFQGDTTSGALSLNHNALADAVIGVMG